MPARLDIWRTGETAYTDYSAWIDGSGPAVATKRHILNQSQVLTFALQDGVDGFGVPEAGNRVRVVTDPYPDWFTGYLLDTPKREIIGCRSDRTPVYGYPCRAISEEITTEWQVSTKFPTLPPFVNKFQGEIIVELLTIFGSHLDTANVDNGILIPFFRVRPDESFASVVQRLSDRTNMKFWTVAGEAWYKAFDDADFGFSPDEDDFDFDPASLEVAPIDNPVFNDVVAFGQVEPQAYVREYFLGDGFKASFPLKFPLFGAASSKLLEDDFTGSLDANRWTETDPDSLISISSGSLRFNGGPSAQNHRLTSKQGLEIAGVLELRAGRVRFGGATNAILGGVFDADTGLLADCIAGFKCLPSGGQTLIQTTISGSTTGPSFVTQSGKTYQFILTINCSQAVRRRRQFFSLLSSFGGEDVAASATVSYSVLELSDNEADAPVEVLTHSVEIADIDEFLYYTLISGPGNGTDSVNLSLNFTLLRKAIRAELWTKEVDASAWKQERLGDKADPLARAAIIVGSEGHELVFFNDRQPVPQEKIKIVYRAAGQARARVKNEASITAEGEKAGDSGVRATILRELNPAPRDAAELERAIQAFIDDRAGQFYEGKWTFNTKSYPPSVEPVPGRFLTVNTPTRFPSNYLTRSEEFDHANWSKVVLGGGALPSVTPNSVVAPNGETTADAITFGSTTSLQTKTVQQITALIPVEGEKFAPSFWLKSPTPTTINIVLGGASQFGSITANLTTQWQRFYLPHTCAGVSASPLIIGIQQVGSQSAKTIHAWGAQLDRGLIPVAYVHTNASPIENVTPFQAFVTEVESSFIATENDGTEIIEHVAAFGQLSRLEENLAAIERPEEALEGALDTLVDVEAVDFNDVAASHAADRPDADFSGTLTDTTLEIDVGEAPSSAYEVRKTDAGWGSAQTLNDILAVDPTTQVFTIPRTSRDILAFIKNRTAGGLLSRYPSAIRVAYPLPPNAPTATVDDTNRLKPIVQVVLPVDAEDVWGVEIRDDDDSTVLHSYSDFLLNITPDDPGLRFVWDNVGAVRTKTLYAYTFNLLGEYSAQYEINISMPAPAPADVAVDEADQSVRWTPDDDADEYEVEVASDLYFNTVVASGRTAGDRFALALEDVVQTRYIRVRAMDEIGFGDWVELDTQPHVYDTAEVTAFNNTDHVTSVPFPAGPRTNPTVPAEFADFARDLINEAWEMFTRERVRE